MAKSNKYEIDWSKVPEVAKQGDYSWKAGEWWFGEEDLEAPLEELQDSIYSHIAWYLFAKEQQSGGTEA
jgi:hypothetical protein